MTRKRVTAIVESSHSNRQMGELLQNFCDDLGITLMKVTIKKVSKPGRPPKPNVLLEYWIERRTKPFSTNTLAAYLGVNRSTAHKKLQRLVETGVMKRIEHDGRVEYLVNRPD